MKEDKTIQYLESFLQNDLSNFNTNLAVLLKDYKRKSKRLDRIIKQSDKQQSKLLELNEELDQYKNHLELKVEEEIEKTKEKELMLIQQSKLAAMGEMMDAVAHQWKQPINLIKMKVDFLEYDFNDALINKEYIKEFQESIFNQINHMNNTLEEFRSFFRPNKEVEEFDVNKMIEKVLFLVKDEFLKNTIEVTITKEQNFTLCGVENEFKHLILNIINNAKDAFNDNNIKKRQIIINLSSNETSKKIEISDNAGGIPQTIIDDIFKANTTTKEEDKGTGIGLYMSSQIAFKHNGELYVENITDGAKFTFELKNI